jgi:uncharacterized protein with HEPN domain
VSRNERDRLRDIKDAIVAIRAHLARAGEEPASEEAGLLHDALLFQLVVIGEAVKHLAPETRDSEPEIPWVERSISRPMPSMSSARVVPSFGG